MCCVNVATVVNCLDTSAGSWKCGPYFIILFMLRFFIFQYQNVCNKFELLNCLTNNKFSSKIYQYLIIPHYEVKCSYEILPTNMKMYEDQSGEFVCEYWGLKDKQEQYIEIAIVLKADTVLFLADKFLGCNKDASFALLYMNVLFQNQENCTPSTKIMRIWCSWPQEGGGGYSLIWAI